MKIALAQINTTVGDFAGNTHKIVESILWAKQSGADVCVFPELSVCGYPPRDLLEKGDFVKSNIEAVREIAPYSKDMAVVLGFVSQNESDVGRALFNSAGFLVDGMIKFIQHKTHLPEYDVFEDARHFEPAGKYGIVDFMGKKIGLSMCEDIWSSHEFTGRKLYKFDPVEKLAHLGADLIINLSASPFTIGKHEVRRKLVCQEASQFNLPIVYVNLVGGNDELVFDGRSFVVDSRGDVVCEGLAFEEDRFVVDMDKMTKQKIYEPLCEDELIKKALVLGLGDYMKKCGFSKVVIGLSGGIDSAIVAAIAVEAIGPDKVFGVMMPSPYSSKESLEDAELLAANLGIKTCKIPIADIYNSYRKTLGFDSNSEISLAEENIQARIRGNLLMAISNREGALVLSTGNKSEISVGYCTLYGDMAGGLALISDLPKTGVYSLANFINRDKKLIPVTIINKPPTAELRPNQLDTDSLPPYDVLDPILKAYVEDGADRDALISLGFDKTVVERVVGLISRNEYKRRQAAPGIKITSKAFGLGRRYPIARKL